MVLALVAVATAIGVIFLFVGYLVDFRFQLRRPQRPAQPRPILKGCAPFVFGSGAEAVMALHGIAGSPAQLREMCAEIASRGFTVYGVLLPGHGTDPDDLYGARWEHWYSHVESEYLRIRRHHAKVHVLGFSVGAALGLRLASEYSVDSLTLISTPVYLFSTWLPTHLMIDLAGCFSSSARTWPQRLPDTPDGPDYMIYNRIALDALRAVVKLVEENRPRLGRVTARTALFHSKADFACKPKSAQFVYDRIGSADKRLVWFDRATHSIMHGTEEERSRLLAEVTSVLRG
jgi:carboxylesterase